MGLLGVSTRTRRAPAQGSGQCVLIALIHEHGLELSFGAPQIEELLRAAIAVVRCHDAITRIQAGQNEVDRGHPARHDHGRRAAFERRQSLFELCARRVAGPRVVEGLPVRRNL